MNYYIQGDATNADKIKAAFEKLGYEKVNVIHIGDYANERLFFFTENGKVRSTLKDCGVANIIKTHPDYKELELPVEPKFKVGDWVVRGEGFVYEPSLITEIRDYYICESQNGERVTYTLNDVHKNFHLWTIADAKDGDVIHTPNNNIFIYKCKGVGVQIYDYCGLYHGKFEPDSSSPNGTYNSCDGYVPATKEQRDLLFAKMKQAGYKWDEKKRELHKIKPHYDVANFQPFDKVLTRDTEGGNWNVNLFSYYIDDEDARVVARFRCMNSLWHQCIPFNDDTKHLLGTTDMPSEEYINW